MIEYRFVYFCVLVWVWFAEANSQHNIMVFVLLIFSLSGCDLTEERQTEKRK
jgi:hypothetical protein